MTHAFLELISRFNVTNEWRKEVKGALNGALNGAFFCSFFRLFAGKNESNYLHILINVGIFGHEIGRNSGIPCT